ncbi:het domain-containing protein [Colletotrichum plurivorum]|uniref:Het domain-containing protein n=1 Tax=Colletotrichum plurivorum TaxID=2175906 RepID=A0A8H6NN09_9PEZI|nr:het domain-containing protein [Colletotrichum plurivorum]
MLLINTQTLELDEFVSSEVAPPYAILSHLWETGEVTFQDWHHQQVRAEKKGSAKIQSTCRQALRDGYTRVWVDTNCIDKSSSAELSEAINSMFAWYHGAAVCYVYMADVPAATLSDTLQENSPFRKSRWFTRGWTLQELLAPRLLVFYANDWSELGSNRNQSLLEVVSSVTGIDITCLNGRRVPVEFSVAQIMSWASSRTTTRPEDRAYCLLGLFEVNMPLLYGEGINAFWRLQQETIKISDDRSIFAFDGATTTLAVSPSLFYRSRHVYKHPAPGRDDMNPISSSYQMTNSGLSIRMPLVPTLSDRFVLGVLDGVFSIRGELGTACVPICSEAYKYQHQYNRVTIPFSWNPISIHTVSDELVPEHERLGRRRHLNFFPGDARDILISNRKTAVDQNIFRLLESFNTNVVFFIVFPGGMSGYRLHHHEGLLEREISMMSLVERDGIGKGILVFKKEGGSGSSDDYVTIYLQAAANHDTTGVEGFDWPRCCRAMASRTPSVSFDDLMSPGVMTKASWVGSTCVATSMVAADVLSPAPKMPAVVLVRIIFNTDELKLVGNDGLIPITNYY